MIAHRKNAGFSMIEVLITIVILMIGLLGLAGLQTKALTAQMEAYQRSQALILLKDMADRINANRKVASCYAVTTDTANGTPFLGTGSAVVPVCATGTAEQQAIAVQDMTDWNELLLGAAEMAAGGGNVGAMIGARGCITQTVAPATGVPSQYLVAVAWQGLNSTVIPAIPCGQNQYGDNDALRRVVALPVTIADLN